MPDLQPMVRAQFFHEGWTGFWWQFGPGLRRQHHQAGQVIGRTSRERHDQQSQEHDGQHQLKYNESHHQAERVLLQQGAAGLHACSPSGLNRYPSPRTVRM